MLLNNPAAFHGTNTSPAVRQMEAVHSSLPEQSAVGRTVTKHPALKGFNSKTEVQRMLSSITCVLHISACTLAPWHSCPPKAGLEMTEFLNRGWFIPSKEEDSAQCSEHRQVPTSHLGLLQKRCLSTTPPPQLREQGDRGLQADQCPWTTAMGFSSSRELH